MKAHKIHTYLNFQMEAMLLDKKSQLMDYIMDARFKLYNTKQLQRYETLFIDNLVVPVI